MKSVWFPISFVSCYLVLYTLMAYLSVFRDVVIMMFVLSPFLVIWMVYRVLKDGKPSGRTFAEHFYDDAEFKRIPDED
jgi:hypothetical protein